jgi:hypothetical protein
MDAPTGKTLTTVQSKLKEGKDGWDFNYVYYDEADQISLMRAPEQLFDYLDDQPEEEKNRVILPHRHHAQPLLSDFTPGLQTKIKVPHAIPFAPYEDSKTVDFKTLISGSCCRTTEKNFMVSNPVRYAGSFAFSVFGQSQRYCHPFLERKVCPPP